MQVFSLKFCFALTNKRLSDQDFFFGSAPILFRKQDIAPPKEIFLYSAFPEIFSRNKSIIRFAATKELISFRNTCCSVIASFSSTAGL